jgi:hypothetical protein
MRPVSVAPVVVAMAVLAGAPVRPPVGRSSTHPHGAIVRETDEAAGPHALTSLKNSEARCRRNITLTAISCSAEFLQKIETKICEFGAKSSDQTTSGSFDHAKCDIYVRTLRKNRHDRQADLLLIFR